MTTHPYIPLYVDDYDAATAHLTIEEDGAYSRLLRLCWRTPGCSLPNDPAWIARKIRLSTDDFARIAQPVLDEFFKLSRGRLVQKRLREEYDDISRKKSARKNAGKKGGDAKAQKTKENASSNASDLPADTRAFPYPEPYPDIEPPNPLEGGVREDRFAEGWDAYPIAGRGNSGPDRAKTEWPGAAERAGGEDALIGAIKAHAARIAADGGRTKNFNRWLRDDGFVAYLGQPTAKAAAAWSGPDEVWQAARKAMGVDLAHSYLAQCRWQASPIMAVVAPHEFAAGKLRSGAGPALAAMGIQIIVESGRAA